MHSTGRIIFALIQWNIKGLLMHTKAKLTCNEGKADDDLNSQRHYKNFEYNRFYAVHLQECINVINWENHEQDPIHEGFKWNQEQTSLTLSFMFFAESYKSAQEHVCYDGPPLKKRCSQRSRPSITI